MIKTFEMTNYSAHASIHSNGFAISINTLPNYILANLYMIRRWLYPLTIGLDSLSRNYIHVSPDVLPSLKSNLKHSVVIGSKSVPSDFSSIENSVIGANCKIGDNCIIKNSIIWDNVKIGQKCVLENCVIASNSTICDEVKISFGCIISFNCIVDKDLPRCRRVTSKSSLDPKGFLIEDEYTANFQEAEHIPNWLLTYINSREELPDSDDSSTFEYVPFPLSEIPLLQLWYYLSPDDFPIEIQDIIDDTQNEVATSSTKDIEEEESNPFSLDLAFQSDAIQFLISCLENGTELVMLQKEFQALMSTREHLEQLDRSAAVIQAIFGFYDKEEIFQGLDFFSELLIEYLPAEEEQVDFLLWFQCYMASSSERFSQFVPFMKQLVDSDYIQKNALDEWGNQQEDSSPLQLQLYKNFKDAA